MVSLNVEGLFIFAKLLWEWHKDCHQSCLDWTTGKLCPSQVSNLAMWRTFSGVLHIRVSKEIPREAQVGYIPGQLQRRWTVVSDGYPQRWHLGNCIQSSLWGYTPALSTLPTCHHEYRHWRAQGSGHWHCVWVCKCVTPLKIVYFFDQHSVNLYIIFVYIAFTGKHSTIMYVNSAFLSRYWPIRNSCDFLHLQP